ncbi:MAG TPA: hypothetical protein VK421_10060 [Pyrinomonadaceae bacterium]|nr:hypothetical protein [Pyrinomonadaceae bacterium]
MFNSMIRSLAGRVASAVVLTLGVVAFTPAGFTVSSSSAAVVAQEDCSPECREQLAMARAATAKYHNVEKALEDGYVQASPCVASPAGAMGYHYVNFSLAADPDIDASQPEALLYLPNESGKLKLVGVEYVRVFTPSAQRPTLFGRPFDGPAFFLNPPQYNLHVWLWKHNPAGMFTPFNPALSCP